MASVKARRAPLTDPHRESEFPAAPASSCDAWAFDHDDLRDIDGLDRAMLPNRREAQIKVYRRGRELGYVLPGEENLREFGDPGEKRLALLVAIADSLLEYVPDALAALTVQRAFQGLPVIGTGDPTAALTAVVRDRYRRAFGITDADRASTSTEVSRNRDLVIEGPFGQAPLRFFTWGLFLEARDRYQAIADAVKDAASTDIQIARGLETSLDLKVTTIRRDVAFIRAAINTRDVVRSHQARFPFIDQRDFCDEIGISSGRSYEAASILVLGSAVDLG